MKRLISWALLCALLLCLAPQALAYSYSDDLPEYVVESFDPNGYCYLYDKPSDVNGRNLGRHDNGEIVHEKSLRCEVFGADTETIKKAADQIKTALNQEAIAIEISEVNSFFY